MQPYLTPPITSSPNRSTIFVATTAVNNTVNIGLSLITASTLFVLLITISTYILLKLFIPI